MIRIALVEDDPACREQLRGYLDRYGNLYLNEYGEEKTRPLSLGKYFFGRWIHRAAEGFRTNLRRLDKWQAA